MVISEDNAAQETLQLHMGTGSTPIQVQLIIANSNDVIVKCSVLFLHMEGGKCDKAQVRDEQSGFNKSVSGK